MTYSPIDEIKNRLDVVEVIGSYIKLQKAGRNFKARCPFHSEKTPSFMVSPERQIWHCFGCSLGGDIFAFVKQIEGVEFGDALRTLAQRAGVVLKRQDPALQTKRKRLYEICELAAKFFETQLQKSNVGKKALQYLIKERSLKTETIKNWRLGWAPDEWHALSSFLKQRGYTDQEIPDSGLVVESEQNQELEIRNQKFYDRFRSRIIFPLFDIQGQVVGFAGRIFGKEDQNVGKYINTPQTFLYDKSRLLYGLNFAKQEIRQKNACIFVEGNMDVIMSHQAGVKNAVASSGTALTPEHLKIIGRSTDNLLFAFDMDLAGESATKRSIDLALENDFNIKIIQIGQKDPADLIKQNPASWQKAIETAGSIMEYYFASTFNKYPAKAGQVKPEDKKQIAKILLPIIKKISSHIERAHWLGELARKIKVDEKTLQAEMQRIKTPGSLTSAEIVPAQNQEKSRVKDLEERLLSIYLNYPEHFKSFSESPQKIFFNQQLIKILEEFKIASEQSSQKEKCLKILKKRVPGELHSQIDYLSIQIEQYPSEESQIAEELKACWRELKILKIKGEMIELNFEIQEAQAINDRKRIEQSMTKFKNLANQLNELS